MRFDGVYQFNHRLEHNGCLFSGGFYVGKCSRKERVIPGKHKEPQLTLIKNWIKLIVVVTICVMCAAHVLFCSVGDTICCPHTQVV